MGIKPPLRGSHRRYASKCARQGRCIVMSGIACRATRHTDRRSSIVWEEPISRHRRRGPRLRHRHRSRRPAGHDAQAGGLRSPRRGKPQPITLFDNTPAAHPLIVMLDVSGSMEGNLPLLRAAAEQLFARLLRTTSARVGTFGHDVTISPTFTRDPTSCGARCRARSRPTRPRRSGAPSTRPWTSSGEEG